MVSQRELGKGFIGIVHIPVRESMERRTEIRRRLDMKELYEIHRILKSLLWSKILYNRTFRFGGQKYVK